MIFTFAQFLSASAPGGGMCPDYWSRLSLSQRPAQEFGLFVKLPGSSDDQPPGEPPKASPQPGPAFTKQFYFHQGKENIP